MLSKMIVTWYIKMLWFNYSMKKFFFLSFIFYLFWQNSLLDIISYVTLDHKTSHKGQFSKIEFYT